jgi:hypothetical protein
MTKLISIAALSLTFLSGAAIAESFDAAGYVPPASTGNFGSNDIGAMQSDRNMETATTSVSCGQSSKEGGGEPSSVDASSPSSGAC